MKRVRSVGLNRVNTRRIKAATPYGALVRTSKQVSNIIHRVASSLRKTTPDKFVSDVVGRISKWLEGQRSKNETFGGVQVIVELNPKLRLVVYKVTIAHLMQDIESAIWTDYVRERCTGDDVLIGQATPYGHKVMVQTDYFAKS